MKNVHYTTNIWPLHLIVSLIVFAHCIIPANASSVTKENQDYAEFFSEVTNFFLFQPHLIKDIFYCMSVLQGNPEIARIHIEKEIFSCHANTTLHTTCPIDRFTLEKKRQRIPNTIEVATDFSRIESRKHKKNIKVVSLFWKPKLLIPPTLKIQEFLSLLNIAKDSKYFRIEKSLTQIKFNVVFERKIELVLNATLANNLIGSQRSCIQQGELNRPECANVTNEVNRTISFDKMDRLTFVLGSVDFAVLDEIGSLTLYLKATQVKINQQYYTPASEKVL